MIVREIDLDEWKRLTEGRALCLFHTADWLKIILRGFPGVIVRLYILARDGGEVVAASPFEFSTRLSFRMAGSPLPRIYTPYQGPIVFTQDEISIASVADQFRKHIKADYLLVLTRPGTEDSLRAPAAARMACAALTTRIIDLTVGPDALWRRVSPSARNKVRQAQHNGVVIVEPDRLDDWLDDYRAMQESVYARQGMKPVATVDFIRALWEKLHPGGHLKVLLARHEGRTLAGAIFPIHEGTIYYLDSSSFREHQRYRCNDLIQWHVISWAASAGLRNYDMVQSFVPSIERFKQSYGGSDVPYLKMEFMRGIRARVAYRLFRRYRSILRRWGI